MHWRLRGLAATAAVLALALAAGSLTACGDFDETGGASSPAAEAQSLSPSPSPIDAAGMSEEDLAALVTTAMGQVAEAAETAATAADSAAAGGEASDDEVAQAVTAAKNAEQLVDYAASALSAYSSQYAAFAEPVAAEAEQLRMYLTDMDEELGTFIEYAEAGDAGAEELAAAAQEAAAGARTAADQLLEKTREWDAARAAARAELIAAAGALKPAEASATAAEALQSAGAFLQALNDALQSTGLTKAKLDAALQAGADAAAGCKAQGGQLAKLGERIEGVMGLLAAGDLPKVKELLPEIESLFP